MDRISGASSTSSAQYASGIDSSPNTRGMNAASLQKWMEAQVGVMWEKVGDATHGVDQRNKAQGTLSDLQRRVDNGETLTEAEVRTAADGMPDGEDKNRVLGLLSSGTPEQIAAADQNVEAAKQALLKADLTMFAQRTQELSNAVNARGALDAHPPLRGPSVSKAFEKAADALEKQNTLAMTELQYLASTAQQAMSLVGNILKIQGDAAKETIGKIS